MMVYDKNYFTCHRIPRNHGNGYPDFIFASMKALLSDSNTACEDIAILDLILSLFNMLNSVVCADFISSTLLTLDSASHKNQISPFANDSPPTYYKVKN